MSNQQLIVKSLAILSDVYKTEVSDVLVAVWQRTLNDIQPSDLEAAIGAHIETSPYFPKPADIRLLAADFALKRQGFPLAMEAWHSVSRGPRNEEAHPLAVEAFRLLGGWSAFGRSEVSAEMSWRGRFLETYTSLLDRHRHDHHLLSERTLDKAGLLEAVNSQKVNVAMGKLLGGMR